MKTTIDAAGRVVVPKALREELGLEPGRDLSVEVRDGVLVIAVLPTEVSLVRRGATLVAKPQAPLPKLTKALVRETLEGWRR